MKFVKTSTNFIPPMPVVLIGTEIDGKANFMTAGWVTRVNMDPPLIAVAVNSKHLTNRGIQDNRQFSICLPGTISKDAVDYCGIHSGNGTDKSTIFDLFKGELDHAPLIEEFPVNLECQLYDAVKLPTSHLYIGEIINVYAATSVITDGKLNIQAIEPMILTMPDNLYWSLGEIAGMAWRDGRNLGK